MRAETAAPNTSVINPAVAFEHPEGIFKAAVPRSWGVIDDPQPGPYGTLRLSESPDLFISSVRVPTGVEPDLEQHMASYFQAEVPLGAAQLETIDNGRAAHRLYGDDNREPPWRWWIRVIHAENRLVTITVSDVATRFDAAAEPYLSVVQQVGVLPVPELDDSVLPSEHKEADIERVLERTAHGFWGRAKDDQGVIEPQGDETRETRLIEGEEALAIVAEAVDVGLAQWCGLDWKPPYYAAQKARREAGWPERKVAYAATLFGSSQGRIQQRVKAEIGDCTEAHRRLVEHRLIARMEALR